MKTFTLVLGLAAVATVSAADTLCNLSLAKEPLPSSAGFNPPSTDSSGSSRSSSGGSSSGGLTAADIEAELMLNDMRNQAAASLNEATLNGANSILSAVGRRLVKRAEPVDPKTLQLDCKDKEKCVSLEGYPICYNPTTNFVRDEVNLSLNAVTGDIIFPDGSKGNLKEPKDREKFISVGETATAVPAKATATASGSSGTGSGAAAGGDKKNENGGGRVVGGIGAVAAVAVAVVGWVL